MKFGFATALLTIAPTQLVFDRGRDDLIEVLVSGTRLQQGRINGKVAAIVAIAHQQSAMFIPQRERLGDALDGIAKPRLSGLGARLGTAFLGDVQGHADNASIAAGVLSEGLAPRIDPNGTTTLGVGHPERHIKAAIGCRCGQRLAQPVAVIRVHAVDDLSAVDHATPAPAEDRAGNIGHEHLVVRKVPFPNPAARSFYGQSKSLLGVQKRLFHIGNPSALKQQDGAQDEGGTERDQQPS